LSRTLEIIPCIAIAEVELNPPDTIYEVSLDYPHTFFISNAQILTHNVVPLLVGIAAPIISIGSLTKVGTALGIISFLLWQKSREKQKLSASNNLPSTNNSSSTSPEPEDPKKRKIKKAQNMYEVFANHPIGLELRNISQKTKYNVQGQSIWQLTEDLKSLGLKQGDLFYLDNLHKDHLEVFSSKGKMTLRTILNLDGTVNISKINAAQLRCLAKIIG